MTSKFLTEDLADVETPFQLEVFFSRHRHLDNDDELYLDPRRMLQDAFDHRKLDVLTYSIKPWPITVKVRRLVTGLMPERLLRGPNVRFLAGLHTKLFLGLDNLGNAKAAYIGSQNFVRPTTLNIGVRITNREKVARLAKYFEAIWELAKPL